jgi:hypothetical protein
VEGYGLTSDFWILFDTFSHRSDNVLLVAVACIGEDSVV